MSIDLTLPDPAASTIPADQPRHTGLEARLADLVVPTLVDLGYELVRIAVLGRDKPTVQIMADRADGSAFTVDDCEQISHAVSAVLDVENPLPNAWTLEVSSAGIDRPLTRIKDWNNHMGHLARVELEQPVEGRRRITGIILGADAQAAQLRLDDGSSFVVPLDLVRRAKLVLTDALIDAAALAAATDSSADETLIARPATLSSENPAANRSPAKAKGADNAKRRRTN